MKIELDKKILEPIKNQMIKSWSVLFGTQMSKILIDRMNNVSKIYLENLLEKSNSVMISKWDSISIDKTFMEFDSFSRPIGFKKEYSKLISIQLGHELLHNISKDKNQSGIITPTNNCRALNEGITQMYAEDIYGFVISKYTDAYKDYKKISKIFRLTLGNEPIYKSYFFHDNSFEKACSNKSGDSQFYYKFNSLLTSHFTISNKKAKIEDKEKKKVLVDLLDKKMEICYKKIILNIILPHLKKLNIYEKKSYIKDLIKIFDDDFQRKLEFKHMLSKYYNFSKEQIKNENEKIEKTDISLSQKFGFVLLLNQEDNSVLSNIFIDNNGKITYNSENGDSIKITDYNLCSEIYKIMFKIKYKNKFPEREINRIEKILKRGENLVIKADTIKDRRIIFEGIKDLLIKRNVIILNSFYECDETNSIKQTIFIKPDTNDIISLNDLKKIYAKFYTKINYDFKGNKVLEVIDRKTGKKINNRKIQKLAYFANMWVEVSSINNNPYSAFDKDMQIFYSKLCYIVKCNKFNSGNIGIEEIVKTFNFGRYKKIIEYLFSDPLKYELIFEFFYYQLSEDSIMQTEREKSLKEYKNNFMEEDNYSFVKFLVK